MAQRAGGDQVIPRPPHWQPGAPAAWEGRAPSPLTVTSVVDVVSARGPGRAPLLELDGARHSAVLIALWDGPAGAEVLLTRRSRFLSTHRGEVSFPGGRLDPGETPIEGALREAHEEVGLDPATATAIGELDHLSTVVSRSLIVPIVASLPARPEVHAASMEVDRVLYVPLGDLVRPGTHREERWGQPPFDRSVHFFELDDETVWGATARMLVQLLDLAFGVSVSGA